MPHIVVEHSADLSERIDIPQILIELHEALAAQGIDKARIKTRAVPLAHTVVGVEGEEGCMLHVTLLLLEGRSVDLRKQLGGALHEIALAAAPENCAVTLEVREMVKDTYFL